MGCGPMGAQAGGAGEFRRPAPARRPPGPARRPPQPRAPRVQPGLRPQPLRRSSDPQSSSGPCLLVARPARVCVLIWAGLPAVGPHWSGHAESPRRQTVRCAGAGGLGDHRRVHQGERLRPGGGAAGPGRGAAAPGASRGGLPEHRHPGPRGAPAPGHAAALGLPPGAARAPGPGPRAAAAPGHHRAAQAARHALPLRVRGPLGRQHPRREQHRGQQDAARHRAGSLKNHQEVDMNVVRICFQASYRDQQGQMRRMDPVLSEPVYDKKSTNTSELRICRINKESGPCTGGEELYLLCDKVQKEDISVVFSRASWEGRADFSQADVHRQIAIVFKTPPYEDLEIIEPVTVNVFLQRLTDGVCSEPLPFTYLPRDHDSYGVDKKRKRGMPDVLGELNSSDPHGIESKRRRKKPAFLDHFLPNPSSGPFLPQSALLPDTDFFPGTVTLPGLEPPGGPDLLDDGFAYDDAAAPTLFTMLDMLPPAPPLASAVVTGNGAAGPAVGEPSGPEPMTLDSYQAPGPGDGGTASLVGSNMFPNQYREVGFGGGLLSPGPEAT
ncbi:transcription factor RelB isoform X3 [Mirounga angustirostris]|uniref:transcription factor RelB isoform X3 n=1 Tax=Mirounga angustirostris TaxID=9716 RepID=UPI00313BC794